jgi:hypothetical protein
MPVCAWLQPFSKTSRPSLSLAGKGVRRTPLFASTFVIIGRISTRQRKRMKGSRPVQKQAVGFAAEKAPPTFCAQGAGPLTTRAH